MSAPVDDLLPALDRIVARHGSAILAERRRLVGLLRDHAPADLPAIRMFMTAFDAGVPTRLAAAGPAVGEAEVARESEALVAAVGCQAELARRAVGTWARVLSRPRAEAPPAPMPLPQGVPAPVRPLPGILPAIQQLPAAQAMPPVQPLPGTASLTGVQPLPLAAAAGTASRKPPRILLRGLLLVAALVAAFVLFRVLAS